MTHRRSPRTWVPRAGLAAMLGIVSFGFSGCQPALSEADPASAASRQLSTDEVSNSVVGGGGNIVHPEPVAPERPARRLTTSELKSLFIGHYLQRGEAHVPYPRTDFSEHFRKDGEYLLLEDNFSDRGTYEIKNDAICVKLYKKPETCRQVYRDGVGRILIMNPNWSEKPVLISLFRETE